MLYVILVTAWFIICMWAIHEASTNYRDINKRDNKTLEESIRYVESITDEGEEK